MFTPIKQWLNRLIDGPSDTGTVQLEHRLRVEASSFVESKDAEYSSTTQLTRPMRRTVSPNTIATNRPRKRTTVLVLASLAAAILLIASIPLIKQRLDAKNSAKGSNTLAHQQQVIEPRDAERIEVDETLQRRRLIQSGIALSRKIASKWSAKEYQTADAAADLDQIRKQSLRYLIVQLPKAGLKLVGMSD